jgi:hypothetical protein
MFDFAPGINAESALGNVRYWRTELSNAPSQMTSQESVATYLKAVEGIDRGLPSLLLGHDWTGALYTPAYWAIRDITDATPRPNPLIDSEVSRLGRWLTDLETELAKMADEDSRINVIAVRLVLDTSALVRAKCFTEVDWPKYFDRKPIRLVIPILVVDELDHLKNTGKSPKARPRLKKIRSILDGHGRGPGDVRGGVTLELLLDPINHLRFSINDQEVIRRADYLRGRPGGQLLLVTGDYTMQFISEANGIPVFFLPVELRLDSDWSVAE